MENVIEIITAPMPPEPSSLNWSEIESLAASISAEHGFDPKTTQVRDLAQNVADGLECIEILPLDQMECLDSGSLKVVGPRNFKIFLSPITAMVRDNFTIAHELGHYFLHSGNPYGSRPITVGRSGANTLIEQQANRFAAALLMPSESFSEAFATVQGNFLVLSGIFNVSRQAVSVRAKSLCLTGA